MDVNVLPKNDTSDNPTGCCPRFNPQGWDNQVLHFVEKPFVRATTLSIFHISINMGSVFTKAFKAIRDADAYDDNDFIILSRDLSPWFSEHYFAITKPVPGLETTKLSGDYLTKVFEGPYREIPNWQSEMAAVAAEQGLDVERIFWFYTTCPRCAKVYGTNYLVAVAKVRPQVR